MLTTWKHTRSLPNHFLSSYEKKASRKEVWRLATLLLSNFPSWDLLQVSEEQFVPTEMARAGNSETISNLLCGKGFAG